MENKTLMSIIAIIFGLIVMIFPMVGVLSVNLIFGIPILLIGLIIIMFTYYSNKNILGFVLGILVLIFGILIIAYPPLLPAISGLLVIIAGIFLLILGLINFIMNEDKFMSLTSIILGIAYIILGYVFGQVEMFGYLIGIWFILTGLISLISEQAL